MEHRRDIDGLRALAVIPVLINHALPAWLPGGFVGVDVFFVISGFLIASIIAREAEEERFSLARFYERRARRILPAFFVVLAFATLGALLVLDPKQLESFGKTMAASLGFASNVYFWRTTSYFAIPTELNPLIHIWSLSLEEQFYLLFPVAFLGVLKLPPKARVAAIGAALAVSLAAGEYLGQRHPSFAFFALPARAWELLAGVLAAIIAGRGPERAAPWAKEALTTLGIGLIVGSLFWVNHLSALPGLCLAPAVAGTALILLFGAESRAAQWVLANPPMVFIGLISYSLYLWHQPIFAFSRAAALNSVLPWQWLIVMGVCVMIAWGSWHWIEQPMRDREKTPSRTIAWAGAAAGAALGACSLLLVVTRGLPQRLGPEIAGILKAEGDFGGVFMRTKDRCQDEGGVLSCRLGVLGRDPTWALVGDSHAIALSRTFHAALEANGASGLALAAGGCPLVDGLRKRPSSPPDDCGEISQRWMEALESPAIRDVMVVGRYPLYLAGERFDNGEGGREEGPGTLMAPKTYSSEEDRRAKAKAGFLKPIQQLLSQGKRVHLIYPIPEAGWSIPRQMVRLALYRQPTTITTSHKRYLERTEEVRGLFDSLGEHPSLFRIRPDQVLCPESAKGRCLTSGPEGPYYADDDHLTQAGADLVLKAELERALRAQE